MAIEAGNQTALVYDILVALGVKVVVVNPGKVRLIAVGFGEVATAINNAAPLVFPDQGVFPGHSSEGS